MVKMMTMGKKMVVMVMVMDGDDDDVQHSAVVLLLRLFCLNIRRNLRPCHTFQIYV